MMAEQRHDRTRKTEPGSKMTMRRNCCVFAGTLIAMWSLTADISPAAAQPYPTQTIRILVGATAGTPPDIINRILAKQLAENEGWRVIVENKAGAMTTLALTELLRQPPDGHLIVPVSLATTVGATLLREPTFRLDVDFDPVIKLATAYHVLVVHPGVSVNSMTELVALLKAAPDKFTFSSGGFG